MGCFFFSLGCFQSKLAFAQGKKERRKKVWLPLSQKDFRCVAYWNSIYLPFNIHRFNYGVLIFGSNLTIFMWAPITIHQFIVFLILASHSKPSPLRWTLKITFSFSSRNRIFFSSYFLFFSCNYISFFYIYYFTLLAIEDILRFSTFFYFDNTGDG